MKKIITLFMTFCLCLALTGCQSKDDEDILAFFSAFHNTLDTESGTIEGSIEMKSAENSIIDLHMQYRQVDDLQLAMRVDLESGGNRQNDFLCFYIRDGKTYLNSMGTTSQSVASNLGIDTKQKISVKDPFMNFTDDELTSFIKSSTKKGDTYSYTLDEQMLSSLLDSFGTVNVQKATLEAVIKKERIQSFTLHIVGTQSLSDSSTDVDFTIQATLDDLNTLDHVDFPSDLENY